MRLEPFVFLFLGVWCILVPEAGSAPNNVSMMADDMGYGVVHALNPEPRIPTPNLDRLTAAATAPLPNGLSLSAAVKSVTGRKRLNTTHHTKTSVGFLLVIWNRVAESRAAEGRDVTKTAATINTRSAVGFYFL
jgi:hypothetical protein